MKQMLIFLSIVALGGLITAFVLFRKHSRAIAPPDDGRQAALQATGADAQTLSAATPSLANPGPGAATDTGEDYDPVRPVVARAVQGTQASVPAPVTAAGDASRVSDPTFAADLPDIRRFPHLSAAMPGQLKVLEGGCQGGILVDSTNGRVLWSKNPGETLPIASITKLMTLYVALDNIDRDPNLSLDTRVPVSKRAMQEGGSQLWLEAGATYPYRDLMQAMMVQSANDAAWTVAEGAAGGDMDAFVAAMNRRSRLLGLREARFYNPNGMPGSSAESDNRASSYDMATLALAMKRFPIVWQWAATGHATFTHQNSQVIEMYNTNRLVRADYPGVNGLKTGWTSRAGYCMTTTVNRQGHELIIVVLGFGRRTDRDDFVKGMIEWAYDQRPL